MDGDTLKQWIKYALLAVAGYFLATQIGAVYWQAQKTHALIVGLAAASNGKSTTEARTWVTREYADRAARAGAVADPDISLERDGSNLVVLATYTAERRLGQCCRLAFDFELSSAGPFIKQLTGSLQE